MLRILVVRDIINFLLWVLKYFCCFFWFCYFKVFDCVSFENKYVEKIEILVVWWIVEIGWDKFGELIRKYLRVINVIELVLLMRNVVFCWDLII